MAFENIRKRYDERYSKMTSDGGRNFMETSKNIIWLVAFIITSYNFPTMVVSLITKIIAF